MTTTPPPMPEPQGGFNDTYAGWVDSSDFTLEQMQARDAQWMERITALEGALKKANDQAEHFEREWYLRGDAIEKLEADRKMLREVLTQTTRLLGELVAKDAQTYAPYMRVIDAASTALRNTHD